MKKVLSSLILAFTLLVSAQAFADPSARSMDALKAKDWQRAEQSLSQDLKENRKDPVTWYFRAQVLNHLQRPDDALKCLDNVVKLDPNFRKDAVDSLRQRLQSNVKVVANSKATGQRIVTESSLERKRAEQNDTYVRNTTVVPAPSSRSEPISKPVAPTPVASTSHNESSGSGFLGFMIALLVVVGGGFFAFSFISKRSTDKAIQKFIKETIAKLVDAYESLKEKRDFLDVSDKKGTYLFERIETLMLDIDSHTRKLKTGKADYDGYAIERTLDEVKTVERKFELKSYDAPVQQPKPEPVRKSVEPVHRYESSPVVPRKTEQPRHEHRNERSRDNGHTTIINNGNSGSDLLNTVATTILVNEALNSQHRTREHEVVRETPIYQDRKEDDDFNLGSVFGSSSSSGSSIFDDSNNRDDFSLGGSSSDSSSTYSDNSSDDDFKL